LDLREFEAVVAIHHLGSFSAASAALFVSQPALTRRVAGLEKELNVKLFTRSTRGVNLTEAGRAFLEPAQRALRETAEIRRALNAVRGDGRKKLLITGAPNLNFGRVGRVIAEFHEAFPDVDVRISRSESTQSALASVEAGLDDLAIVDMPVHTAAIVSTSVWEEEYLAVFASTGNRPPDGIIPCATRELLHGRPMIRLPEATYPSQHAKHFWEMVGVEPSSTIETDHGEMLIPLALGGRGVAVVTRAAALEAYAAGAWIARPPRPITSSIGFARHNGEPSPTVGRFLRLATSQRRALAPAL
jgi:DNA-binding transcriptional LysR family regulator